jgi:ubiquinone/menaquinone biosynthesis C-methylase UbiE
MDPAAMDLLCTCYPHKKGDRSVIEPQFIHRLNLSRVWGIQSGWRVLDIGCGQGDSTLVLAHQVGPDGHVTGVDPASPDYGSPYTLGQAQAYLRASALGSRIDFRRADAPSFLASDDGRQLEFDTATMCHSLWYFATRETVATLFGALAAAPNVRRVCLAEYAGRAGTPEQAPHELAARVQRLLHQVKKQVRGDDDVDAGNVREALEPDELEELAQAAGWKVGARGVLEAPEDMGDGRWEVQAATAPEFKEAVLAEKLDAEKEEELLAYIPKIETLLQDLKKEGKRVRTMDVAWIVLER